MQIYLDSHGTHHEVAHAIIMTINLNTCFADISQTMSTIYHKQCPQYITNNVHNISQTMSTLLILCIFLLLERQQKLNTFERSCENSSSSDWRTEGEDISVVPESPHKGYGSLEMIYPRCKSAGDLEHLRLLDRTADIFIDCLGFREAIRMGPSGFRTFTR